MSCFEGRPGADLPPMDLDLTKEMLNEKWGKRSEGKGNDDIRDIDVMSYAMYPAVFDEVSYSSMIAFDYFAHAKKSVKPFSCKVHGTS